MTSSPVTIAVALPAADIQALIQGKSVTITLTSSGLAELAQPGASVNLVVIPPANAAQFLWPLGKS